MGSVIRVALAEDNVLLREGVSRLVAADKELELVGVAGDLPQLFAVIERCEPDVVITDIRMPPTGRDEGIQAAAWLREHRPEVGVVVLSQYTDARLRRGPARARLGGPRLPAEGAGGQRGRAGPRGAHGGRGGSVIDPLVVDELVRSRSHPAASTWTR